MSGESPEVESTLASGAAVMPGPARIPASPAAAPFPFVLALIALAVGGTLTAAFGARFLERMLDTSDCVAAFLLGVVAWGFVVAGAYLGLRGRSYAKGAFPPAVFASMIGVIWAFATLVAMLNETLDDTHPVRREAVVREVHHHRRSHHVLVDSWRKPGELQELGGRHSDFGGVQPGNRIVIDERPGWLGWPWVKVEPAK